MGLYVFILVCFKLTDLLFREWQDLVLPEDSEAEQFVHFADSFLAGLFRVKLVVRLRVLGPCIRGYSHGHVRGHKHGSTLHFFRLARKNAEVRKT